MDAKTAQQWADCAEAQSTSLRAELLQALKNIKKGTGESKSLSYADLSGQTQDDCDGDNRAIEARWRRALAPASDDDPVIGQILSALYRFKDRIIPGETPRVRRILNNEREPSLRLNEIFYSDCKTKQDVSGLSGYWRLVHQRSDGQGFLSWLLNVDLSIEPYGGPGAWFSMETRVPRSGSYNSKNIGHFVSEKANGAIHSSGAMFYLVGSDQEKRLITGSFQSSGGQIPANEFHRAHGLIQRVGSRGLYAARAVLSKIDEIDERDIGSFTGNLSTIEVSEGLIEDINTLFSSKNNSEEPGYLLSLLNANDVYGT